MEVKLTKNFTGLKREGGVYFHTAKFTTDLPPDEGKNEERCLHIVNALYEGGFIKPHKKSDGSDDWSRLMPFLVYSGKDGGAPGYFLILEEKVNSEDIHKDEGIMLNNLSKEINLSI